jgi:hypothetical protein
MAKLSFDDIRNKEKGKVGIVCGTGGSLKEYHEEFEKLSKTEKDKYCFISCNEWHEKTNLDVDYWVIANNVFTVEKHFEEFNNHKSTLIYADSVDVTDREFVEKNLTIDYLPYDQRHNKGIPCSKPLACCNHIIEGRKTISEYLQHITGFEQTYGDCGTVAIHMLAIAVILGCNPIYISGVDMNYKTGYVDDKKQDKHDDIARHSSEFGIQSKVIADSADKLGVKIINLSKEAAYGGIEKGEFVKNE